MNKRTKTLFLNLINSILSPKLSIYIITLIAILLAIATFIEQNHSTEIAKTYIYHQPLFFLLLLLASINLIGVSIKSNYLRSKKLGMLIFHFSFILILIGAATTHLFGFEGILHLREGERSNIFVERIIKPKNEDFKPHTLPFQVTLVNFQVDRYPGSNSPSSYKSEIIIETLKERRTEQLSVNHIVHENGYRLYQMAFDPDEKGSIITINYDPYGTIITYIGYLSLLIGVLFILLSKHSRFHILTQKIVGISSSKRAYLLLITCLPFTQMVGIDFHPSKKEIFPSQKVADAFGKLLVQSYTGRIEPMNTFSNNLFRKLTHHTSFNKYTADQILLSNLLYPDYWQTHALLYQPNIKIHQIAGTEGKQIALSDLFDKNGEYKLQAIEQSTFTSNNNKQTQLHKELLELNERVRLLTALHNATNLKIFPLPNDKENRWFSPGDHLSEFSGQDSMFVSKVFPILMNEISQSIETKKDDECLEIIKMIHIYQQKKSNTLLMTPEKVNWEIKYNHWRIFDEIYKLYFAFASILMITSVTALLRSSKTNRNIHRLTLLLLLIVWVAHTFGLALRSYYSEQPIGSNAYESMVVLSWATILSGLILSRQSSLVTALSTLLGGFVLLVAHFNYINPQITPLAPVLQSGWLMAHVATIMSSYGLFGLSFLIGILTLILISINKKSALSTQIQLLRWINELSITIGLCLLSIGTFLGAIWANESWGRYWGWDPKETWALISMLVYALVIHARFIPKFRSNFVFSTLSILALTSVLMTYFGVNILLSGKHSYGDTTAQGTLQYITITFIPLLIFIGFVGYQQAKREKQKKNYRGEGTQKEEH